MGARKPPYSRPHLIPSRAAEGRKLGTPPPSPGASTGCRWYGREGAGRERPPGRRRRSRSDRGRRGPRPGRGNRWPCAAPCGGRRRPGAGAGRRPDEDLAGERDGPEGPRPPVAPPTSGSALHLSARSSLKEARSPEPAITRPRATAAVPRHISRTGLSGRWARATGSRPPSRPPFPPG